MSCTNFDFFSLKDAEDCLYKVEVCDDVMSCACCCYFLEKLKHDTSQRIIESLEIIPPTITRIRIPIYPIPDNNLYYSFDGISTIVYNLLKTTNKKHRKALEKNEVLLKVFYEKMSLFTIPVIIIELIFLKELKAVSVDEFWKTLKAEVLFFTGSVGDIDVLEVLDTEHLYELLKMPLLFGYPEFKEEGVLKENGFKPEQIREMNYLHSMQVLRLDMKSTINNSSLELFQYQKDAIKNEKGSYTQTYNRSDDEEDVIRAIFGDESYSGSDSNDEFDKMVEDLPF